jgi:PadR family transcriptional regulator PadR
MTEDMNVEVVNSRAMDKWRGQNRKGFLELCVLTCIRGTGSTYGFALLESLQTAGLEVGEGSIYPLLARLVREGMLVATWETPEAGHPRKYYRLSDAGSRFQEAVLSEWQCDQAALARIQGEEYAGGRGSVGKGRMV